jgi:hypothetical protein
MSRFFGLGVACLGLGAQIAMAQAGLDTFGIAQFHPTKAGTRIWTSAHWANGKARTFSWATDPDDPTAWTDDHSGGTDGFRIDGKGTMTMSGSGPRFHINSTNASLVPAQLFLNTEFTAYYQRKGANGSNWGGMIVGARSGPLGHASSGGNDCDATTYYGRFRNDGKWDIEKELKHPGSTYWSGSGYGTQDPLWHGGLLPQNRWIGMKYLVYNIDNDAHVKLELYIDTLSNGNPVGGGQWQKVGSVTDSGNWNSGDVSGCGYAQNTIINPGHGTFLLRTDNDTAVYKMVSLREIDLSTNPTEIVKSGALTASRLRVEWLGSQVRVRRNGALLDPASVSWSRLDGRKLPAPAEAGLVVATVATDAGRLRQLVFVPAH